MLLCFTIKGRKKRMKFFMILLTFLISFPGFSQDYPKKYGKTITLANPLLDSLISIRKQSSAVSQSVPGYRVQLYFGPDRKKANEIKQQFFQKFPDYSAYVLYQQPHYKVRAGDCKTRLQAARLKREIISDFPGSFEVRDEISLMPLE